MKKIILSLLALLLLFSCKTTGNRSSSSYDEYKDSFKNGVYTNSDIGFSLKYPGDWTVYSAYKGFPEQLKEAAKMMKEQGAPILSTGHTNNKIFWFRLSVEDVELPLDTYFTIVRSINQNQIKDDDAHRKFTVNDIEVIEWVMTSKNQVNGMEFSYLEYQFVKDGYNMRLTFWTITSMLDMYKVEAEKIINTLEFTD